ncbi:HNH endonuclease [Burkholderia cenocepacia]|uniref:HNH endonuclease n=1 Tax=Burkholderia cenocepacia TaxID=95486 RepID=UPI002B2558F3|nr:HNH endonuclease [Burkholderia cenocepacia]MEB2554088.1 HNH endonuclease [Burkholderia cenocepacia]
MKNLVQKITLDRLHEMLDYSIVSGRFYWKIDRTGGVKAGDMAGSIDPRGYQCITLNGRQYFAHRLAWLWLTGEWPKKFVDHANGMRAANGWHNLREATNAENQQNQKPRTSKTGIKGVCINIKRGVPHVLAYIDANGRHIQKYFGHDTPENRSAAASWVRAKRKEMHGEFANHGHLEASHV